MTPPPNPPGWRWHAGALLLYAALAILIIDHGVSMTKDIFGQGTDPTAFIWFLAWWPWALAHHIDPLYTDLLWQPLGVHLAWVASLPLLSLIGLPFTILSGPVLTFNVLILTAPVCAAWAAYRLCLRISGFAPAAVVGGYLFGFSSYEMAQDSASLNLSVTVVVPLLLLLILTRLDNEISRPRMVLFGAALLIAQFMVGAEVFAMMFVFGGMAWLLALVYVPARRAVLRRLFIDGLLTAPLVLLCLSPFLISMARNAHVVHLPTAWPFYFTADLLNFFVPTPTNLIAGPLFAAVSDHFKGGFQERDAYIGLPLMFIIYFFAREAKNAGPGRLLTVLFLAFAIASLGPYPWVAGHFINIGMPWFFFVHLPVLSSALPARFALFVSLVVAIIAARWIADAGSSQARRRRLALGVISCIALLPRPFPSIKVPHSSFFQPGQVEATLGVRPRILVLPFAINGPSSFWQQESRFSFRQTGGYLGFPPAPMQHFEAVGELFGNFQGPNFLNDLTDFCLQTQTQYVVAGPGTSDALMSLLAKLKWPAKKIDDVTIYTVPARSAG